MYCFCTQSPGWSRHARGYPRLLAYALHLGHSWIPTNSFQDFACCPHVRNGGGEAGPDGPAHTVTRVPSDLRSDGMVEVRGVSSGLRPSGFCSLSASSTWPSSKSNGGGEGSRTPVQNTLPVVFYVVRFSYWVPALGGVLTIGMGSTIGFSRALSRPAGADMASYQVHIQHWFVIVRHSQHD